MQCIACWDTEKKAAQRKLQKIQAYVTAKLQSELSEDAQRIANKVIQMIEKKD